jgi:hypothetical protein
MMYSVFPFIMGGVVLNSEELQPTWLVLCASGGCVEQLKIIWVGLAARAEWVVNRIPRATTIRIRVNADF